MTDTMEPRPGRLHHRMLDIPTAGRALAGIGAFV